MPEADIHRAVRLGDVKWLKRLLTLHPERVDSPLLVTDATPLHIACYEGQPEVVRMLLAWGAEVNARDARGETPLHKAVEHRANSFLRALFLGRQCLAAAKALLEHRADANAEDISGDTPLHRAAMLGRVPFIVLLLAYGADTTRLNDHGLTPLRTAMQHRQRHAVDALRAFLDKMPFEVE